MVKIFYSYGDQGEIFGKKDKHIVIDTFIPFSIPESFNWSKSVSFCRNTTGTYICNAMQGKPTYENHPMYSVYLTYTIRNFATHTNTHTHRDIWKREEENWRAWQWDEKSKVCENELLICAMWYSWIVLLIIRIKIKMERKTYGRMKADGRLIRMEREKGMAKETEKWVSYLSK